MSAASPVLLIATVGGTPEPVLFAVRSHQPSRMIFVASAESKADFLTKTAGRIDTADDNYFLLSDVQNPATCIRELRGLEAEVRLFRSQGGEVVVDFTGGTKCMSAALGLVARYWPCTLSYVAGQSRDKSGLGVTQTGSEFVVAPFNPWVQLGYQEIETALDLCDHGEYTAADRLLLALIRKTGERGAELDFESGLKRLRDVVTGLAEWDAFNHKGAIHTFKQAIKGWQSVESLALPLSPGVVEFMEIRALPQLQAIVAARDESGNKPVLELALDILANARRRIAQGRFDDATARCYRAIEATAQAALWSAHQIDTGRIQWDQVPPSLRDRWEYRFNDQGTMKSGLQDAYELAAVLNLPVGLMFRDSDLHGLHSPLSKRNHSILAHGFDRVSEKTAVSLLEHGCRLAGVKPTELVEFPRMLLVG